MVAGEVIAVARFAERAATEGWQTTPLPVSHAFHTSLVAVAVPLLAEQLACEDFARLERPVISTITGATLSDQEDLPALLCRQVTSPVQFTTALAALLRGAIPAHDTAGQRVLATRIVDLLIEVGPGTVLSGLVQDSSNVPVVGAGCRGQFFNRSAASGWRSLRSGCTRAAGAAVCRPFQPAILVRFETQVLR